ncbi:MAG TPA: class I SAM-dependent methyltransferase [Tepidiformaceae bacterium]
MESWSSAARYEPYVGRWSRMVAPRFLAWLGLPGGLRWLDVGCGTGALTGAILDTASPVHVLGVDRAADYVAFARAEIRDGRAAFEVGDAAALPVDDGAFDVAVSGLVLNFVPDPLAAVVEMRRALTAGGEIAAYLWDYAGGMEFLRRFWDAATALDSAAESLDQGQRFPLCAPGPLEELFEAARLERIEVMAIDIETRFRDFDDFWLPFLGGQGSAPAYVAGLDAGRQSALREHLRETLPATSDGSISMTARAWAVRGHR